MTSCCGVNYHLPSTPPPPCLDHHDADDDNADNDEVALATSHLVVSHPYPIWLEPHPISATAFHPINVVIMTLRVCPLSMCVNADGELPPSMQPSYFATPDFSGLIWRSEAISPQVHDQTQFWIWAFHRELCKRLEAADTAEIEFRLIDLDAEWWSDNHFFEIVD